MLGKNLGTISALILHFDSACLYPRSMATSIHTSVIGNWDWNAFNLSIVVG